MSAPGAEASALPMTSNPTLADRLARSVPPDSRMVLELCAPNGSVANRIRSFNPAIRFAIVELSPHGLTAADLTTRLGSSPSLFDSLIVHEGVLSQPDPFALIAAAQKYLHPGAPTFIVFPRGWLQQELGWKETGQIPAGQLQSLLMRRCGLRTDSASTVFPAGTAKGDFSFLILRAVSAAVPLPRLLVQAMTLRPVGACNDTRIHLPNSFLATVPGVRVMSSVGHLTRLTEYPPDEHRIAILQRRISKTDDLPGLKRILQEGYLLIAEFDDHPSHWPSIAEADNLTFQAVHAVQTSTDFLADELRPLNEEVGVFPNQIATLPPLRQPRTDDRITLFFGAFNRDEDWRPLMEPLNRLIAANRERVAVQVIHDRAFFDALDTDNKTFTPACGYQDYIRILNRCDIGLLPLNDTLFNRCKSDLKFIECAAHSVVALASPVVYGAVIADGETGFLFRTPEEFSTHLARLIADRGLRAEVAERAHRYIATQRLLAQHFRKRLSWYQSLISRKAELDARLFERVPALRP